MIEGIRFSLSYLERGTPEADSSRMRKRVSGKYTKDFSTLTDRLVEEIKTELGAEVPWRYMSHDMPKFFTECELRDFLDVITIIYQSLAKLDTEIAQDWRQFVVRVFEEENVGYRLDSEGGVHFRIDEEFERNRSSALAGISAFPAVQEAFERSYQFLDSSPPDTLSSVRSIFESVEIMYKHIVSSEGKDRLNSLGIQQKIKPIVQKSLGDDKVAIDAMNHLLDGVCDWIDAGHMYRHGQKVESPSPPTIDFTILYVSHGAGILRFLISHA